MKRFRFLLSIFILLVAVIAMGTALSASSSTCGDNLTWVLDDEGTFTISGNGVMKDYYYSSFPWDSSKDTIKSVVINNGVTTVGEAAFRSCSNLTSVTIPNSVTSIGKDAFCYCSSLISVTIPDSVTSISDYAFQCSGRDNDGIIFCC